MVKQMQSPRGVVTSDWSEKFRKISRKETMVDSFLSRTTSLQFSTLLKRDSFIRISSGILKKFSGHLFCGTSMNSIVRERVIGRCSVGNLFWKRLQNSLKTLAMSFLLSKSYRPTTFLLIANCSFVLIFIIFLEQPFKKSQVINSCS